MGFWGTMALTVLWMPVVMYFCGYLLKHCADAEINGWIQPLFYFFSLQKILTN